MTKRGRIRDLLDDADKAIGATFDLGNLAIRPAAQNGKLAEGSQASHLHTTSQTINSAWLVALTPVLWATVCRVCVRSMRGRRCVSGFASTIACLREDEMR